MRQVILGFNRLSLLEVTQLSREMKEYTGNTGMDTEVPSDAEGCWWNIDHFVYSVSESLLRNTQGRGSQEALLEALRNLQKRAPGAQSTEYLKLLWAARMDDQRSIEAIHKFIDRCGYGGARQTLGELYSVVLPFGELLIGQHELSSELRAVNKGLVEEAMWTSLEWLSETGIAHSSWMTALASTNSSFARRDVLFRRAYDLASRLPGGEFQMTNCALMLSVIHASMPPTTAATPLLKCAGTELSPATRAAHYLTLAKDAAGRIEGLGLRELATSRVALVELYLHKLWGTAAGAATMNGAEQSAPAVVAQEALVHLDRGEYATAAAKASAAVKESGGDSEHCNEAYRAVCVKRALLGGDTLAADSLCGQKCYVSLALQGQLSEAYERACRESDATQHPDPAKAAEALLEKADALFRGGNFVGALYPALQSLAICEPLGLHVTAAAAALSLARSIVAEDGDHEAACDRALALVESADRVSGLLPPHITAQAHYLRAKCLLRKTAADESAAKENIKMMQAAAGELGRALALYEKIDDTVNVAQTCHALALTCNALGWTKLRDEMAEKWQASVAKLSHIQKQQF